MAADREVAHEDVAAEGIGCAAAPCPACPYKKSVPSGIWDGSEYKKIVAYDLPTGQQPTAIFLCHENHGGICTGWVQCHSRRPHEFALLALRLHCDKLARVPRCSARLLRQRGTAWRRLTDRGARRRTPPAAFSSNAPNARKRETTMAKFDVEILKDGKICLDMNDMSGEHHHSADEFVKLVESLMGGPVESKSKRAGLRAHSHGHEHGHEHDHHHH